MLRVSAFVTIRAETMMQPERGRWDRELIEWFADDLVMEVVSKAFEFLVILFLALTALTVINTIWAGVAGSGMKSWSESWDELTRRDSGPKETLEKRVFEPLPTLKDVEDKVKNHVSTGLSPEWKAMLATTKRNRNK